MFTSFGPTTLQELRQAWAQVDAAVHVHEFQDLRIVGDALVAAQLALPVMDTETLTLTYSSVPEVMRDLKRIGATNASHDRQRGLLGRERYSRLIQAYEMFRQQDNRYPASYEIVYGHAWGPDVKTAQKQQEFSGIPINMKVKGRDL